VLKPSQFCLLRHDALRVESLPVDIAAKWVLVVDDDEDTREIVVECLRSEGYLAVAAPGAVAALRMMGQGAPSLVLSDLTMGKMDGRELLASARGLLGSSMPPFVFVTGVEASRRLDVVEQVLTKPYGLDELLSVVGHHVRA
jgi:CheY-like chemotaxis protein